MELKKRLTKSPVLAYPTFDHEFILETDACIKGLGAVLSQVQQDGKLHPVAYASRSLTPQERNYSVTELETLAVVWAMSHYHYYLYGHSVKVYTDHSAVWAVLDSPNPTAKHARWWTRVYGKGVKNVQIMYRAGKENVNADALSRSPQASTSGTDDGGVHVAVIDTDSIQSLLQKGSVPTDELGEIDFAQEQLKDQRIREMTTFLKDGKLPHDGTQAHKIVAQAPHYSLVSGILYYVDPRKRNYKQAVVPQHLRKLVMEKTHGGPLGGHFAVNKLYKALATHWYWEKMYADIQDFCKNCPQCAIVSGCGHRNRPTLHPIPVQCPFQIVGVDIMDLPTTQQGNKHMVVFQDFFSKWPPVFPVSDQKTATLVQLLTKEVIPLFGVPEALLSDRGTNLLSHLMHNVCAMLGIEKLNTTACHPACNGMVERFDHALKTALHKHADRFGCQWDRYLSGMLWAYHNTPHDTTTEKPSFLLFGIDLREPTEAALLPPTSVTPTNVDDYREELMLSLSSACDVATQSIQKAQERYKQYHDKKAALTEFKLGQWVLVRFPQEESGRQRKLSRPWHGPYRIISRDDPDLTVQMVYFPDDGPIQVHQSRVTRCPSQFPAGYYWYGDKHRGPRCPPKWVTVLLTTDKGSKRSESQPEKPEPGPMSPTQVQDSDLSKK